MVIPPTPSTADTIDDSMPSLFPSLLYLTLLLLLALALPRRPIADSQEADSRTRAGDSFLLLSVTRHSCCKRAFENSKSPLGEVLADSTQARTASIPSTAVMLGVKREGDFPEGEWKPKRESVVPIPDFHS
ncbi:hypothetical protein PIB30_099562 [Stylosanthes scabra]|uniref:Uncharacterized protein n=1 Tax=Stylosanthes scabra TaxID=79078 RepID=A0ABU6SXP1_9FABA|nr:hypothetical protein [Stylosanthes scabra]